MNEKEWAGWSFDCKTDSGQFLDGPGWIKKLTVTSDGSGAASAKFYDGHNANGTLKIALRSVNNQTFCSADFEIPIKVEQGLYVEVASNADSITAQYKKAKP